MIDSIQDVPGAFIGLGWRALGLLLAACAVLAAALSLLFVAVTTDAFSWLTVAALVGAIFGAMIAVFAVFAIRRAFGTLRDYFQGEQERIRLNQKALLRESEPRYAAPKPDAERLAVTTGIPSVPDLAVSSTNQANNDFTLALNMFSAALIALSKQKDGEKLNVKPFAYDAMNAAGFVARWEDWARVLDLWENSGLVENPRARSGWKVLVSDVGTAEQRLSSLYAHSGYVKYNGTWVKR